MGGSSHVLWNGIYLSIFITVFAFPGKPANELNGIDRETCAYRRAQIMQPINENRQRLFDLREEMRIRASIRGQEIDAYIIPAFDEHQNEEVNERDRRLQFLTGFSGTTGIAAVTMTRAAFWTNSKYLRQANGELSCDWDLFLLGGNVSITEWLIENLAPDTRVGADPHLIPHFMWIAWDRDLYKRFISLVKVNNNLVDVIWGPNRPPPEDASIRVLDIKYAGEKWESKILTLREIMKEKEADAIVLTSLTEIAYILNLRGRDIPYTPVFKAYLIVTHEMIYMYTNKTRVTLPIKIHIRTESCFNKLCVSVRDYDRIWRELRTFAQVWRRVILPGQCVFDMGASQAVHAGLPAHIVVETTSPVILMRAKKNSAEREGMRISHIRDGAAMCDAMSYLESRYDRGDRWTEQKLKLEIERSRMTQRHVEGLSIRTIVAFGQHAALPEYIPSNVTDIEVTDESTVIIESGAQYLEGTTDVTRTFHLGEPTQEQRIAYTNILAGIIRLSTLKFPENVKPSEIDAVSRSPVWDSMSDYPHGSGHGIGSYLSVHESPIDVSYTTDNKFTFKPGYFFSNEPGYYKTGSFGIRLENVLEVVDTGRRHPSGSKFLAFEGVTLVPYETKLIDRTLLSAQDKRWLNEYNAKIRILVGEELKQQGNMQAFYWMMNQTRHIREYLPEDEYRKSINTAETSNIFSIFLLSVVFVHLTNIL